MRPSKFTVCKPCNLIITTFNNDPSTFEYSLVHYDEHVFKHNGRNTNIEFLFQNKLKIHAKDNDTIVYNLEFERVDEADAVADRIIGVNSAPYEVST